jgi:Fe-S-cluster containining protein
MKELIIKCNKCGAICPQPNGYVSFIYLNLETENRIIKQRVIEENYCPDHGDKIRIFIKEMK